MITIQLLLFGISADLLGTSSLVLTIKKNCSVKECKALLVQKYPQLTTIDSYAIAVNETYATEKTVLKEKDVVAIIPPVSGG